MCLNYTNIECSSDEDAEQAMAALSAMKVSAATLRMENTPNTAGGKLDTNTAKSAAKTEMPQVNYRRCFDKTKQRFYYVNTVTGESKWRPPTEGIVLCV